MNMLCAVDSGCSFKVVNKVEFLAQVNLFTSLIVNVFFQLKEKRNVTYILDGLRTVLGKLLQKCSALLLASLLFF